MKAYNVRDGIFEALLHRFSIDPTMVPSRGEPRLGRRLRRVSRLTEALPYHRLFNSPISEAASWAPRWLWPRAGPRGGRADVRGFHGRAGDEIFNQLSKWQAMSAGDLYMPVVLRISVGPNTARSIPRMDRPGVSHPG